MPSILGRNYLHHLCFTKIKSPLALPQQSPQTQFTPDDHNRPLPTTTTSTSILIKNFNSLYDDLTTTEPPATVATTTTTTISSSDSDSDTETTINAAAATPDFATIYASQRFFFSSPGRSNSIVDSSASSASSSSSLSETIPESEPLVSTNSSIAVQTYSPDPYVDFRSSMQEMVEARDLKDVQANWDYLHELLLCYLALNPKTTHKYIVRAFADLLISLMPPPPPPPGSDGRNDDISGGSCSVKRKFK